MKIAFVANYGYWGAFDPSWIAPEGGRMLGGGETVIIQVSRELAKRGHEVHVFTETPKEAVFDKVHWHPIPTRRGLREDAAAEREALSDSYGLWDAVIGIDQPFLFDGPDCVPTRLAVLDSNCNHGVSNETYDFVDLMIARSDWHAAQLCRLLPGRPDKFQIIGLGVDLRRYKPNLPKIKHRMVWSSSPDRGLHHMLAIFRLIRERVPDATLDVYYERERWFQRVKYDMSKLADVAWFIQENIGQSGVRSFGGVDQWKLARAQLEADIFLYPCDTPNPSEGFCMTALENMAAGNPTLLSPCDALPEVYAGVAGFPGGFPIDHQVWADAACRLWQDPDMQKKLVKAGHQLAGQLIWPNVAKRYEKVLNKALRQKERG